jgi:hypothetical protein
VAAHAVGAETEVAHRVELAELDALALERLRDDRPGDVARVLARPVVVEHPRDDARHAVRVVVVHGQEVGRDLGRRVDRLRVDRGALVEDEAARVVEVVVVRDRLARIAVLLRRPGRVELLQLEAVLDDRLEQVERADRVRHHRLVRAVPGLADVGLSAEVEDVRPVGGVTELADQVVDGRPVGQVREVHLQQVADLPDVVQRAARGGADERVHVRLQLEQRLREVGAHETVRPRHEDGAAGEELRELSAQGVEAVVSPGRIAFV